MVHVFSLFQLVLSVGKDLPRSAFTQSRWELPETVEAVLPKPHDSMERENPHNFQAESEELEVLTDFENDEELELVELEAFKSVVTDIYVSDAINGK